MHRMRLSGCLRLGILQVEIRVFYGGNNLLEVKLVNLIEEHASRMHCCRIEVCSCPHSACRRLVPHGRPGLPGRGGLPDPDRAHQGAHQPRRRKDFAHRGALLACSVFCFCLVEFCVLVS